MLSILYIVGSAHFPVTGRVPTWSSGQVAAGVKAGDLVEVTIELDLEPHTVEVPADLAAALAAQPGAAPTFDALSYTMRKAYVRQVEEAKAPATRERRIVGIVVKLGNS